MTDPTDSAVQAFARTIYRARYADPDLADAIWQTKNAEEREQWYRAGSAVLASPAFHAAVQAEVERRVGAVKPKVHARTCFPYEVTYIAGDGSRVRGPRYGSRENAENAAAAVKARRGYVEAVIDKHPCTCGMEPTQGIEDDDECCDICAGPGNCPRFEKENAMSNLTIIDAHDDAICGDDSNRVCAECVSYEGSLGD